MINLTQHSPTPEQFAAGVIDPPAEMKAEIIRLLNFTTIPTREEVVVKAEKLAHIVAEWAYEEEDLRNGQEVMIGGAPYLMGPLEKALTLRGMTPFYAFSERVSSEETLPDGSVRKTQIFRHAGFIPA